MSKRLTDYLARQAAAVRDGGELLAAGDASSTHATRVAIRRYRSALTAFRDRFPGDDARRLDRELRWYAGVLGAVRDRQVLRVFFSDVLDEWSDPEATIRLRPVLLGRLDHEVAEHWAVVQRRLTQKRYRRLLSDLAAQQVEPVTDGELSRALGLAAERFSHRLAEAEADDTDEELLHDARKRAKQARYLAGLLDTEAARDLGLRFARMQEVLGAHQDHVVAATFVAGLPHDAAVEPAIGPDLAALRLHLLRMTITLRRQAIAEAHALGLTTGPAIASRS